MTHEHHGATPQDNDPLLKRYRFVFLAFLAIAFFYLAVEHTAHLFGFLPILFLLACPILHIFMHGGGHRHGGSVPGPTDGSSARAAPPPSTDNHQH